MNDCKAYLFGSVARGDQDRTSDIDVLLVYDKMLDSRLRADIREQVSSAMSKRCSFAEYSSGHLERMFKEGHLFAWHLYLESRPIPGWEDRLEYLQTFPSPASYTGGLVDAMNFSNLLKSAQQSIIHGSKSPVYEAGIAYVALRNVGMSLSSSTLEVPCFSRFAPFELSTQLQLDPPCSKVFYQKLINARHASQRGLPVSPIAQEKLVDGIESAYTWTKYIIEVAREKSFC